MLFRRHWGIVLILALLLSIILPPTGALASRGNSPYRVEVDLGDGSDADYKLQYMLAAMAQLPADSRGSLDLSFLDGERAIFHPLG